jgi:hypothetical protein
VAKGQGTEGTLISFQAYEGMGAPMKEVVESLKAKEIEKVGLWLTLQGYWNSIDKDSPLVKKYDCSPYKTANRGQVRGGVDIPLPAGPRADQWLPSPEKAAEFWLDWFTEMKSWGIDFVKVGFRVIHGRVTDGRSTIKQITIKLPEMVLGISNKPCGLACWLQSKRLGDQQRGSSCACRITSVCSTDQAV